MTRASILHTVPSPEEARVFLARARQFQSDADVEAVSDTGRELLLHQASVAACDAVLAVAGVRVVGDEGGHALRLSETVSRLGLDEDVADALTTTRRLRNASAYGAGIVIGHQVEESGEAVDHLIEAVTLFMGD